MSEILSEKLGCYRCLKNPKFEGFDRESRPRPFQTMFHVQIFFCFLVEQNLMDSFYILWNKFQDYQLNKPFLVTA